MPVQEDIPKERGEPSQLKEEGAKQMEISKKRVAVEELEVKVKIKKEKSEGGGLKGFLVPRGCSNHYMKKSVPIILSDEYSPVEENEPLVEETRGALVRVSPARDLLNEDTKDFCIGSLPRDIETPVAVDCH